MNVQLLLFGGLRLVVEERPARWNVLPKTTPLLAYLVLQRAAPVARDLLAFTLWPDVGEAEARSNLRRHLHDLRRSLPAAPSAQPWLLINSDTIQWNSAAGVWVDVAAFEALSADPARLADAVALYTGDLLPTCYEDWLVIHRERLRTLLLDDLLRLMQRSHAERAYTTAIGYGQQLLQHDPLREDVVRWLMTLRHESGDRTGALQEYQRFAQRLREALDVPPMVETNALYDAIARQLVTQVAPAAPEPSRSTDDALPLDNLPAQLTTFIGREAEVAAIRNLLTAPDHGVRLLTLTGAGGCGKTRLALEAATRLRHEAPNPFPDGYFFVPLSSVREASTVVAAIASALAIRESGNQTLLTSLKETLRTRRLLLLLDNFEHLTAAAPLLGELLSIAPGLRIVVTSRAVLRLYGEHEFPVTPLPVPAAGEQMSAERLARYDAVALFSTRSRAVNPRFVLNNENAEIIAEICRQLDGLPLAIELAAARSKLLTPSALLARLTGALGARLAFLIDRNRNLDERHQTLRATLTWSYQLLPPAEQLLFQQLAVFVGSFSYEAVEAVCGQSSSLDVLAALETLVDNSLLDRVESDLGAGVEAPYEDLRFQMLSMIREYALEQFEQLPMAHQVRRRHALYFLTLAQEAEPQLQGAGQLRWLKRLELEQENWRAALTWALANEPAGDHIGLALAAALGSFWLLYGYWAEGHRWLDQALARYPQAPAAVRAKTLCALASIVHAQGDLRDAQPIFAQSLALYRALGDERGMADALYGLGRLVNRLGRYDEAETLLQESLSRARGANYDYRVAYALNILAFVYVMRQDLARAHNTYDQALTIARRNQDQAGMAFFLTAVGELARQKDDYAQADAYYQEAMSLARSLGQTARVMMLLHNRAYIALRQGDAGSAAQRFRDCLKLGLELPDKENFGMCLIGLGCVAVVTGEQERAIQLFAAGERALAELGASLSPSDQREYDAYRAVVRKELPPEQFAAAWAAGETLTPDQTQSLALAQNSPGRFSDAARTPPC